jgi:dTMP kinase
VTRSVCEQLSTLGLQVIDMNFPDRSSSIGKMINDYLSNKSDISNETIHLLFSANRWENLAKIEKLLCSGVSVVCDRYWYSGVAYSCAKGMDYEWCTAPDRGLLEPDVVIYLQADPEVLKNRSNYGEEKYERVEFQKKVSQAFEKMFVREESGKVKILKVGEKALKDVIEEARAIVTSLLETNSH